MQQGFVTIATGNERYYRMARNLLRSYRQNCREQMRFALIADRHNEYTEEFDDVVILESATNSWLDKLALLKYCPYNENIFIDADCLIYKDINFFWNLFSEAGDFSCFGKAFPLGSKEGWFYDQAAEVYPIHFLTHLHGMLYFIRRGETINQMYALCQDIMTNYHSIKFKYFNDRLADEPVFALAMAILNLRPIERVPEYYCFVPFATSVSCEYLSRHVHFTYPGEGSIESCCIIHWGNINTKRAAYRLECHKINYLFLQKTGMAASIYECFFYRTHLLSVLYCVEDKFVQIWEKISWFTGRVYTKLFKHN